MMKFQLLEYNCFTTFIIVSWIKGNEDGLCAVFSLICWCDDDYDYEDAKHGSVKRNRRGDSKGAQHKKGIFFWMG